MDCREEGWKPALERERSRIYLNALPAGRELDESDEGTVGDIQDMLAIETANRHLGRDAVLL